MHKPFSKRPLRLLAGLACFALLTQAQTPRPDPRERWNSVYANKQQLANPEPNAFLVSMVKGRKPGRALDIGMGQGRNSVWLAQQGWDVTGLDISDVAIGLALDRAKDAGVTMHTMQKDLSEWDYGKEQWDLVLLCYMQGDARFRARQIIDSLRPGGLVIIETWHQDMDEHLGRKVSGFETNEVFKLYGDIRIRHYEDVLAVPDWGKELGGVPRPLVRIMAEKPGPKS